MKYVNITTQAILGDGSDKPHTGDWYPESGNEQSVQTQVDTILSSVSSLAWDNRKAQLIKEVHAGFDRRTELLGMKSYPDSEQKAFTEKKDAYKKWTTLTTAQKEVEVTGYTTNPTTYNSDVLILLAECTFAGATLTDKVTEVDTLAGVIGVKSSLYSKVIGILTKDRKRMEAEINLIVKPGNNSTADLDSYAITWSV